MHSNNMNNAMGMEWKYAFTFFFFRYHYVLYRNNDICRQKHFHLHKGGPNYSCRQNPQHVKSRVLFHKSSIYPAVEAGVGRGRVEKVGGGG